MSDHSGPGWTSTGRIGFRFMFSYLVLFFFPFPSGLVNPGWLGTLFDGFWERIVPWFGHTFIGISVAHVNSGSGDTMFDYVRVAAMLGLAAAITVVWSVLDRRRTNYRTLHAWARMWMRYVLAVSMLTFGAVKILMIQFEPPGYGRLIQPLGEFSPMALLWTFMGVSTVYTFFTGAIEVIGAILLFFRRTTTLGALIIAGSMSQVLALNLSYDVPVKLGSLHILLLALVLLASDARRLLDFFVLNRATRPASLPPQRPSGRLHRWSLGLKTVVIAAFLIYLGWDASNAYTRQVAGREDDPTPPEGWYRVVTLTVDGNRVMPMTAGQFRWRTVSLRNSRVGVRSVDGSLQRFRADGDPARGEALLYPLDSAQRLTVVSGSVGSLSLRLGEGERASLKGILSGHAFEADIQRQNPADFPLTSRGFRWISQAPYFR